MDNFIEQLVAEYYKTKGYLVSTNYWIPFLSPRQRTQNGVDQQYEAQSWTDIDVLARNNEELLLIQVKAIVNQKSVADKIVDYFHRLEDFFEFGKAIDGVSDITWWTKGVKIRYFVIYEYYSPPSYLNRLTDNGIEVVQFSDFFKDIMDYAENKKGVKEQYSTMRFLHFLIKERFLNKNSR